MGRVTWDGCYSHRQLCTEAERVSAGGLGVCVGETPGRSLYPHLGCRQLTIRGILALMCSQRMLKLVLKDKELRLGLPPPQQPCSLWSDQPPLLRVGRRWHLAICVTNDLYLGPLGQRAPSPGNRSNPNYLAGWQGN